MKNSCRCALLDFMLGQLAAKRKEAELLGKPLNNACINEILSSGDEICCTLTFIAFMTYCCTGSQALTRDLRQLMLHSPCNCGMDLPPERP